MKLWCAGTAVLWMLFTASANALHVGDSWPANLRLTDLQGRSWNAQGWRGKVTVVGVWASWCEPCSSTLAQLNQLYRQSDRASVAVFGISIDADEGDARAYLKAHPVAFPVVHDGTHALVKRIGVQRVPSVFVIDQQGKLRRIFAGPAQQDHTGLRSTVAKLLAAKAPTKAGFSQNE